MRLSRRVIGYVSAVMCALSLVLIAAAAVASLSGAQKADETDALRESTRAEHAVREREDVLGRNALDWSAWDDTYEFVNGRNPTYLDTNVPLDTLDTLQISLFAIYDSNGRPIHIAGYDLVAETSATILGADRLLLSNPALNIASGSSEAKTGLVELPDGKLLLVGAGQIMPSAEDAEPVGTLVMGRLLDDAEIATISESTQLALSLPSKTQARVDPPSAGTRVLPGNIEVTIDLADVSGHTVGALRVLADRNAFRESVRSLGFLGLIMAVTIMVTVFVIHRGLRRIVIDRVGRLDEFVEHIRAHGHAEPVRDEDGDELGTLNANVGEMVSALVSTRREVELRVAELSGALSDARSEMERREVAEEAKQISESRYRLVINNMEDAVFILGSDGIIRFVNPSVETILGRDPDVLVGCKIQSLLDRDSGERLVGRLGRGLTEAGTRMAVQALTQENQLIDAEVILTPFDGAFGEIQAILRDVTDRKRHENELIHIATHDFLTGLCNRRYFEEELRRELAQSKRRGKRGAVLWLDLDNFKDVNDTLGHAAGDEMLIEVASRLVSVVRAESLLARLGGDEFAVLLPGADCTEATEAAERLRVEVNDVVLHFEGKVARASTSIGVVLYPEHGQGIDELLSRADVAMYEAKEMGRSRVKVFEASEEWRDQIEDRRVWIEMVELALAEDGLIVDAQPIIDTKDGRIVSYELLVRMDYQGEIIPPDRFLPVADRVGLIVDIDLWVLRQAVGILEACSDADFGLNVNVSARTLGDPRFLSELECLLAESTIDASRLTIEITETTIIIDLAGAQDALGRIKRLGCRIALDDFGSGFTSFLHLRQLPIDDVKIDGTFVQSLFDSTNDQHLVLVMVEMARGLNMRTTAESVESAETLALLQSYGVDFAQGFHIARPGPAHAVIDRGHEGPRPATATRGQKPEMLKLSGPPTT